MAWGTAVLSAGGGIIGDIMGAQSQEQTNLMNFQIAQMNNDFNAQQAQLNRNFQLQTQGQAENFMNMESSTAIQRRAQDLAAAGLNPQLAVGNPASSPMIGGMGGSTAQSAGNPTMVSPMQAFSQLGAQTAQALQAGANVKLANAQADQASAQAKKTTSETPSDTQPGQGDDAAEVSVGPNHYLGDQTLANLKANNELTTAEKNKTLNLANYIIAQQYNTDADTGGKNIANATAGQEYKILMATKDAYITEMQQIGTHAQNEMGVDKTWFGRGISYINRALPAVNTAISAASLGKAGGMNKTWNYNQGTFPTGAQIPTLQPPGE